MKRIPQTIRLRPEHRELHPRLHDMAAISTDATTQAWWKLTDPCQEAWAGTGTGGSWSDLTEIWHLHPSQGDAR